LKTEIESALAELGESASRVSQIVADLKSFSRPTATVSENTTISLRPCVEWARRATSLELNVHDKVIIDYAGVNTAFGHHEGLAQVLANVLSNAAHALSKKSTGEKEIRVSFNEKQNGQVCIDVRDTGIGMSEEVLQRVFEPFVTTKEIGDGTGLGLSICRGVMHSMGGDISLSSEEGRGTTVHLSLPERPQEALKESAIVETATPEARKPRILVVDDEPMVMNAIRRILSKYELVCWDRATKALDVVRAGESFDLILSDVMMPEMTGIEFYEGLIRHDPEIAKKFVFLTGGANTQAAEEFLEGLPNPCIKKPFSAESLRAALRDLLAQRGPLSSESQEPAPARTAAP
jgi:CheY-like chemotaxis protein/two-component sensor histidine kinase